VVLFGVYESELRESLVSNFRRAATKFAAAYRGMYVCACVCNFFFTSMYV